MTTIRPNAEPAVTAPSAGDIFLIDGSTGVRALAATSVPILDASGNTVINNLITGFTSTPTAAGTTTLTVASAAVQYFTGSLGQTVVLPVVSTLALNQTWTIENASTGIITVNSSGGNLVSAIGPGATVSFKCVSLTGTSAASWSTKFDAVLAASGKVLTVSNSLTLAGTDGTTQTFPATSAAIARTDAGQTFTGTQVFGVLTATSFNGNVWTAGSGTLTLGAGKTLTASNSLTLAGTDGTTLTFQGTDTYVSRTSTDTLTNKTFDTAGTGNVFKVNGTSVTAIAAANGLATLDSSGKLSSSQIPASLVGALQYQGTWNATTNSPALVSSTGTQGQYYKVATAGTTAINGISTWNVGDTIVFDGTTWDKIDGISSEVVSVAGLTGVVTLAASNLTNGVTGSGAVVLAASPALSGTITGTYTLGGTPTITAPTINGGALSGTFSGTPTLSGANFVTRANLAQVAASSLSGNPTGSLANESAVTLGSTLNFSGSTLNATTATTSQLGVVKPDGTTITISAGVISATGGVATSIGPTTNVVGQINPGVLTNVGGSLASLPYTSTTAMGFTNVSGSAASTTGTISAAGTTLAVASALDFKNSQGIRVNHAGTANGLGAPSGLTVTPTGTAGSTTYTYTVAPFTATGGYGAAITAVATTTGNATLSATNFNALSWTAASGAAGYAVYGHTSGSMALLAFVGGTSFSDVGTTMFASQGAPDWMPGTPPGSGAANWLVTSVSSGGGSTSLTLAAAATTTATTQGVYHDDTVALQAALTSALASSLPLNLGGGIFRITSALTGAGPVHIYGNGPVVGVSPGSVVLTSPTQDGFQFTGNYIVLEDFNFQGGGGTSSGQIAGSFVNFTTGSGAVWIERINSQFGFNNISAPSGSGPFYISKNLLSGYGSAIAIFNCGDSSIDSNELAPISIPGATNGFGINLSGDPGGARITNNKINAGGYGYAIGIQVVASSSDGDLIIGLNSIEQFTIDGILIDRTGSPTFANIIVTANQLTGTGRGIYSPSSTAWISKISITNNVIFIAGGLEPIAIIAATTMVVEGNVLTGTGTGITIGANVTQCIIGANAFNSVTTQITDSSGVATYSAITSTAPGAGLTPFTPTVTSAAGTLGSVSSTCGWRSIGKTFFIQGTITITAGSGSGALLISGLPATASGPSIAMGADGGTCYQMWLNVGSAGSTSTTIAVFTISGSGPITTIVTNGGKLYFFMTYQGV